MGKVGVEVVGVRVIGLCQRNEFEVPRRGPILSILLLIPEA